MIQAIKRSRFFLLAVLLSCTQIIFAQNPENWTSKQLLAPAELAGTIREGKALPILFSVGPGALIPHSQAMGMVREKDNLEKFKKELSGLPKDARIIIYCGCCPFEHCPNVRPAIALLKEMKFSNYQLLDLPHNLKTDWIDKGYPMEKN
jgi:thiosulfate/3-mercaptopyruvate sulfurtransferase